MSTANIFNLGVKELRSLARDPLLLTIVVFAFTVQIVTTAQSESDTIHNASIAIVDEDDSQLSRSLIAAISASPHFKTPELIQRNVVDELLDRGSYAFVLDIPPGFERDTRAHRSPGLQLSIDATRSLVAYVGSGYIQAIVASTLADVGGLRNAPDTATLRSRVRFNPNLVRGWFLAIMTLVEQITMLAIVLTGAALLREREHGTLEHLLVMPVKPAEIVAAKIWSMSIVVLVATTFSLEVVIQRLLDIPIRGSVALFLVGVALHLFAATSMGIFFGTVARSMPQLGLLVILILMPMNLLSGGTTPLESQPQVVRFVMAFAPTTHFVRYAQAILFRDADWRIVLRDYLEVTAIGAVFFFAGLWRFRRSLAAST